MKQKLQFVYNAEAGFFNKVTDFAHKIISPDTYACSLCALTYGKFTIRREWAEYVKQLPLDVEFVYKDQWKFAPVREAYPLVALQTGEDRIEVLLEAEELNAIKSLEQLISRLDKALQSACC
ncbi:GTPase [Pontibacter sp. FD36]|uniref:GTPase n=1 Tax=Pontibacter sp. FD36 TaxID=2789860 RepID=UPI0018A9933D|nr:GTPase [Pontibacter sp. FD36]MBF8965487.1 GTPase [Pontibacter sp. FD36]